MVKFDLNKIPKKWDIDRAVIVFHNVNTKFCTRAIGFYPVTELWDEDVVTWNNKPGADFSIKNGDFVIDSIRNTYEYDVTEIIQKIQRNEIVNHGFVIKLVNEKEAHFEYKFYSSEYYIQGKRPRLDVTITIPDIVPLVQKKVSNMFNSAKITSDNICFSLPLFEKNTVSIYSVIGTKITAVVLTEGTTIYKWSESLLPGSYVLLLENCNGTKSTKFSIVD